MELTSLTCEICGFKGDDLIPHIEKKHTSDGGLNWYVKKFKITEVKRLVSPGKQDSVAELGKQILDILPGKNPHVPPLIKDYFFVDPIDDIVQDIKENRRILLTGHTGSGKTSCIEQIAARINQSLFKCNMNGQTTSSDFIGLWTAKAGETVWVDGFLPTAMKEGYWILLDEVDFTDPAILSNLNAVLEPGGKLIIKEKGYEVVEPHPNFRIFGTGNSIGRMQDYRGLYQGTNIMNEAFLDRFRCYEIGYVPKEIEAKIVKSYNPKLTTKIIDRTVDVANTIRDAFEKEEISSTFSTRKVIDWSQQIMRHRDPVKAAQSTIYSKVSKEDAEVINGIITRVMLGNRSE